MQYVTDYHHDYQKKITDTGVQTLLKTTINNEKILLYFFIVLAGFLVIALMLFVPKAPGELPIKTSFPFDTTISPGHEIAMYLQTAAVTFGLYSIVAMDSLAINICRCLSIQLLALSSNYEKCMIQTYDRCHLITSRSIKPSKRSDLQSREKTIVIRKFALFRKQEEREESDSFVKRFRLCEIHHQRIISMINEFNSIFSSCMLMQIFSSFSMICFAGFQAVLVSGC
nr:PREDICTED: uncharacterized protein LOC105262946 [Fopius arisanus]